MKTLRSLVAAPVTVLALATLSACGSSSTGSDAPEPASSASSDGAASDDGATSSDGTLALTVDGTTAGKCAVPSAETLAGLDTAFAGTVSSIDGGTVTLDVDEWYAGGDGSTVTVEAPGEDLQDLLMAVDFQEGSRYLVSAEGGRVSLCGFTAEETPDLQALYDQAFAG